MKKIVIDGFDEYLKHINEIKELGDNIVLFRGQRYYNFRKTTTLYTINTNNKDSRISKY